MLDVLEERQGPQNRFVATVEAIRIGLLCLWRREPYDRELSPYFAAQSNAVLRTALSSRRRRNGSIEHPAEDGPIGRCASLCVQSCSPQPSDLELADRGSSGTH